MKKRIICALAGIMVLTMIAGPVSDAIDGVPKVGTTVLAASTAAKGNKDNRKKKDADTTIDFESEEDINDFLKGDWRLIDPLCDEEYGTLTLDGTGGCSFILDCEDEPAEGDFYVYQNQRYDTEIDDYVQEEEYRTFNIGFSDIPTGYRIPTENETGWEPMEREISGGLFYIARGNGYDYLSLSWLGNGDSFIFTNIFQNKERLEEELEETGCNKLQERWVFVRENDGLSDMELREDDDFYAYLWQTEEDNRYFLQPVEPVMYETEEEYTGRRLLGGYFLENEDISVSEYYFAEDCDESLVLDNNRLHNGYPAKIYHVTTDEDSKISSVEDVNETFYGEYDFGNLEQEFECDGTSFTINGFTTELKDMDTIANAVMDIYQVGDYIITECHINPHVGLYYLTNIYTNMIVKEIEGANLTWIDDDITTAVYSVWDSLYDFEGNLIGSVDGDEIDEVEINSSGTKVKVTDFDGNKYTFDIEPDVDEAMYRYAEFAYHPTAEKWNRFMELVPDDALALVIENPPENILRLLPYVQPNSDEFPEYVYVVALDNGMVVRFDQGEIDFDTDDLEFVPEKTLEEHRLEKTEVTGISMVIPEGPPSVCIYAANWLEGGTLPIAMLNGQYVQYSTFITAEMSREEIDEAKPGTTVKRGADSLDYKGKDLAEGFTEADLIDAYEEILEAYKEVQEEGYSTEELDEMGFYSALMDQGWPSASSDDAVTYQVMDINGDDVVELLISYYGSVIDIYALNTLNPDGPTVEPAYYCPYRGQITLYEDGYLEEVFSGTASSGSVIWYKFDADMGTYFPVAESLFSATKKDPDHHEFYSFSYSDKKDRDRMIETYSENGSIPVWAWEWNDEITENEYLSMGSKAPSMKILDVLPLSDFDGLGVG
ncbi:MAG: hypothetical protein K6G22_00850 [Lachnospiraceae bacterium]|nr:hypothetical protein [Lachnospiraceae bacterium]